MLNINTVYQSDQCNLLFSAFPFSFMVKKLGTRVMGWAGTSLVAGGYILAGTFPSIPMLFVAYGFLPSTY